MKRLFCTGACGFIGTNFIKYWRAKHPDDEILNFDALTYAGNPENLKEFVNDPKYKFVLGDVTDLKALERAWHDFNPTHVVHMAAESHVDRSINDASPFMRTNVMGTFNMLNMLRAHPVEKYVQVSTDEVYGSLSPREPTFTEESPLQPNSPYAASKASADMLVRAYYNTFGLPCVVTRCSNNYGPYQFPEKLIPLAITRMIDHKDIPVYGDGLQVRDWIHVGDHCAALDAVLEEGMPGQVYNIGGNHEVTNIKLVKTLLDILVKPHSLIRHVADRPGHDRRYAVDTDKMLGACSWVPAVDFEEGLRATVRWYLDNPAWLDNVRTGDYREYLAKQYGRQVLA